MYKLIGRRDSKPFECVGTKAEVKFSLNNLMEKLDVLNNNKKLPILLEKYKEIYLEEQNRQKSKLEEKEIELKEKLNENHNLYLVYNKDNYLPDFLEKIIKNAIKGD